MRRGLAGIDRRAASLTLLGAAVTSLSSVRPGRAKGSASGLRAGVNLSHWFAQPYEQTSAAHYLHFVSDEALNAIKAAGLTHVRLCVDPGLLFKAGAQPAIDESVFRFVSLALDRIASTGLVAVFDIHPVGSAKNILLTPEGANRFVAGWSLLASRLASRHLSNLYLEVLNEPSPLKGPYWWDLQERAVTAIRAAGARQTIIVNPGAFSGIDVLIESKPYRDPDLVYTVHCYEPLLFTHQGTDWSWDVARRTSGLGWPEAPSMAKPSAEASTKDQEAAGFVADAVASGDFTRSAMADRIARLKRWQEDNGNPRIYVGEFGVYTKSAPINARLDWVRSARTLFEGHGWGWCYWDASVEFGLYSRGGRRKAIDPAMLDALGLAA